jgi:membrane peptidoglycan carboxypeptidase
MLTTFEKLVLVLEDRRFLRHDGVDGRACVRELIKAMFRRRHGGASTIDMQFVRTATGYHELTFRRKLYEMLLAMVIQYRYSKLLILRSYLACAFYGSHLYGVSKASSVIFGKSASELSVQEMAELAAMLVYPRPLRSGEEWRIRVKRRAAYGVKLLPRFEQRFNQIPRRE